MIDTYVSCALVIAAVFTALVLAAAPYMQDDDDHPPSTSLDI